MPVRSRTRRGAWALGAGLALAAAAGCESDYEVTNDDGTGGAGGGVPDIEVTPSRLDFGQVEAGLTQSLIVQIRNVGTGTLQLHAFPLDAPDSFVLSDDGLDRLLAPDEAVELPVTYAPYTSESASGMLWVESNDPVDTSVPVDLVAIGLAPRIEITPWTWDMGDWEIGCDTDTELTIRNVGTVALELHGLSFEPTSPEFGLVDPGVAGQTLEPGAQVEVFVTYTPADTLEDASYLYVDSNDPANPRALATQSGTGHLGDRIIDSFIQEGNNWTDILWVVDNSCSMSEEQTSMATNFSAFLGIIEAADVDYHVAVVTTDNATFRNGDGIKVIDTGTADADGAFAAMVNVGTNGSGSEMGLKYGADALASSMTDPGGPNEGFLREEAGLRVVFLSDEEDQSPNTVNSYVTFFQGLKLNPDHVVLSAISGQTLGCSSATGDAYAAPRYEQAVSSTSGISASICSPDWIETMTELAWASLSFQDTFPLSAEPVVESIEVYVNSVPIYVGWSFDPDLNAVLFEHDYIPDNGDKVDIAYNRLGMCEG